ncbi:MAG: FAD-dependent oxidoreductase [Verrucomicrobiota bacterium]
MLARPGTARPTPKRSRLAAATRSGHSHGIKTANSFDVLLVGHGLAGACLAHALRERGQRVLVFDSGHSETSSQVAAGLMNPVTGRHFQPTWRYAESFARARRFYRAQESAWKASFFEERHLIRFFAHPTQSRKAREKSEQGLYADWVSQHTEAFLELRNAGLLRSEAFLRASQKNLQESGSYRQETFLDQDVQPNSQGLHYQDLQARHLVFCRGYREASGAWFGGLPFRSAKGEILDLTIPGWQEERILNRGNWLAPVAEERYRTGATYSWDPLDEEPTPEARAQIEARLLPLCPQPYRVTGQRAAVRPILEGRKPVLLTHPQHPPLHLLNGLGSKGSLYAPWCAQELARHLVEGAPIDPALTPRYGFQHASESD